MNVSSFFFSYADFYKKKKTYKKLPRHQFFFLNNLNISYQRIQAHLKIQENLFFTDEI